MVYRNGAIKKNQVRIPPGIILFYRICLLTGLFSFGPLPVYSQNNLDFEHLTVTEGLTQNVTVIFRDSRNFMWFGSVNGIYRYDGIYVTQFNSSVYDSTSLTDGSIRVIFEDSNHNLWAGTDNGLNIFNYKNENFTRVYPEPPGKNSSPDNFIVNISEDSKGRIWVITTRGLRYYDHESGTFSELKQPVKQLTEEIAIEASFTRNSDTIYFFAGGKVYRYFTDKDLFDITVHEIKTSEVNSLLVTGSHEIWLGTEYDGAYKIDDKGNKSHFSVEEKTTSGLQSISVKSINTDSKRNIWLSTRNGLYRLNRDGRTFTMFENEYGNPGSLLSSYTICLYEDCQGIIWVSTVGGINKFNPESLRFRHFKTNGLPGRALKGTYYSDDNLIWNFYRDNRDILWVGAMRTNLSYIPFKEIDKGVFTIADFYEKGRKISAPFNSVFGIAGDKKDNLWLSTDNGLYYYNTRNRELTAYLHLADNPNSLINNTVGAIALYFDSILWVGTDDGLSRYNIPKNRFSNYIHNPDDSTSLISNYIFALYIDSNEKLWVLTDGGLSIADLDYWRQHPEQKVKFRNLKMTDSDGDVVINDLILSKHSPEGLYWVGTDNGFFSMDESLKIIKSYSVPDGLPNKIVYQIREDSQGQLWLSTDNGLSCFNPETEKFWNFTTSDGLQANEFNSNASFVDKNGFFYFGGINGFNLFHPDSLSISEYSPRIVISRMNIFNEPVEINKDVNGFVLGESIYETSDIKLSYRQNFFSFEFSALDYSDPGKIQYEYMLEGFDETWVSVKNNHFAQYTNVRHGNYVFMVRSTNSDGVWCDNTAKLNIKIIPPFWRTNLFYLGLLLLLIATIYIINKVRFKSLERDKSLLEEEVQKRTVEINKINQDLVKSKAFTESVINNATYGITVITREGKILLANPAAALLTGYSQEELLSMNYKDLTPEKWREIDEKILDELEKGQAAYHEKEYIKKDGTIVQVAISNSFIKNYDMPAIVNIINDITERVSNEKELQEYRTNLERLVKERTADLMVAKERAEKADKLKTAFLSNISHEVRTPMNAIMGFTHLIKDGSGDSEHLNEYLDRITTGAQNLLTIVTNIVEISRISADDITISSDRFNIIRLIYDIFSRYRSNVETKDIDFVLENKTAYKELYIVSDRSKLMTIIDHLLDNALKFTSKGHIKLHYTVNNDFIEVGVQDSGIGISPDHLAEVFEPFKQADTTFSRAYGGTGLGLAISKAYIEKMGGRIWAESVIGTGSTFYFTFPYERCDDFIDPHLKETVKPKELNILIVEDEEINYYYLAQILKKKSKNIFYAYDGYSAIEQCRNNPLINLVLMDIKLPGINGLEATAEIKKFRPDLPVIAQTAYTLIGDREKALLAGCNDYISKPINMEKLFTIIKNYVTI